MKRIVKLVLNVGLLLSLGVGIWHFFVPYIYDWYSYLPGAPRVIIVSIDWINFFFSEFLTGSSILLIIFQKEIKLKNRGVFSFYAFLVFIWFSRVIITIVHPWNKEFQLMDIAQILIFSFVFFLLLLPMLYYVKQKG